MEKFKKGDQVFIADTDNGLFAFGTLIIIHNEEEADLQFNNGNSISPVMLEDCQHVDNSLWHYGLYLEKIEQACVDIAERMGYTHPDI